MKRIALLTALAASLAAPAVAQTSAAAFAQQHFNQDYDGIDNVRMVPGTDTNEVAVSSRGAMLIDDVFARFNMDADTPSDIRGYDGGTVIASEPAFGAEIFERLRAESLENE